jgi:glycosyltransferase involved in cell wall biosynthesis
VHIVHGYLYEGNVIGMLAARLAGTPIRIASKRSLDRYPRRVQREATRLANACAHRIVCNAEEVRRFVLEEERPPAAKLGVIPNGIRLPKDAVGAERPASVPPGAQIVGAIGRLSWKKAYPDLFDALARVRAARPDVHLVVVGDGPLRAELEADAARRGLAGHVHFLGEVHDVRALLHGFDVFAISSVIEGMPNVLLEALAAERPVVATRVGGIPEIVTDGKSGVLVPPSDPAALAAGMLRLLENPAEAALFGAAGRRVAESRFGVGTMVERFTQLYDELLAEHGLTPAAARPVPRLVTGRG